MLPSLELDVQNEMQASPIQGDITQLVPTRQVPSGWFLNRPLRIKNPNQTGRSGQ
jgi:hypothetical protein